MSHPVRKWLFLFAVIALVLGADQFSKAVVVDKVQVYQSIQPIPALAPLFQITRIENSGSAFGFLPQAGDLFLIIAVVVTIAMVYFYPRIDDGNWLLRTAIGLVVGGALGNAFDRIHYGVVVDFIHYQIPALGLSNVSNLADHAIVFGVIIVFLDSWRADRQADKAAKEAPAESQESEPAPLDPSDAGPVPADPPSSDDE